MNSTTHESDRLAQREEQMKQAEELLGTMPQKPGVAKGLFEGQFVADWVFPYPQLQTAERPDVERAVADLTQFCDEHLDPARIDRDYSPESGTYAADLDGQVDEELVAERLAELRELQDGITAARRDALIGATVDVLVDEPGVGRTYREAPEIDGIVEVPEDLEPGTFHRLVVTSANGPDLVAAP